MFYLNYYLFDYYCPYETKKYLKTLKKISMNYFLPVSFEIKINFSFTCKINKLNNLIKIIVY